MPRKCTSKGHDVSSHFQRHPELLCSSLDLHVRALAEILVQDPSGYIQLTRAMIGRFNNDRHSQSPQAPTPAQRVL